MNEQDLVEVHVPVRLTHKALDAIMKWRPDGDSPDDNTPGAKVAIAVNGLLADLAEGGLMLSGEDIGRMATALPEVSPESIVNAVDASAGMERGQIVVKWVVDPTLVEPLRQKAYEQGVTLEDLCQNMMDTATAAGWFYDLDAQVKQIFVTQEDIATFREMLGKGATESIIGRDIIDWLVKSGILIPESAEPVINELVEAQA